MAKAIPFSLRIDDDLNKLLVRFRLSAFLNKPHYAKDDGKNRHWNDGSKK